MLREEVIREWEILKDYLVSEKTVKEKADKLQQQELHQKNTRIIDLEQSLEEMRSKLDRFINKLVEVTNLWVRGYTAESKIKQLEGRHLFQREFQFGELISPSEPNPQSAIVRGDVNWLISLLRKVERKLGCKGNHPSSDDTGENEPTIEEVD